MGEKKTRIIFPKERTCTTSNAELCTSIRFLRKADLGGVIFGCKNYTMSECLEKQLFGLPAQHFQYVKNIDAGLPLFLFNYSDRKLHGIFAAASVGQMNIDPYAWTTDGTDRTSFPAQVRIRGTAQRQALTEAQFRPIISDNYYSQSHFWFELDHAQVERLIRLYASSSGKPQKAPTRNKLLNNLPKVMPQPPSAWLKANKYETLTWNLSEAEDGDCDPFETQLDFQDSQQVHGNSQAPGYNPVIEEQCQTPVCDTGNTTLEIHKDLVLLKLQELSVKHACPNLNQSTKVCSEYITADVSGDMQQEGEQVEVDQMTVAKEFESSPTTNPQSIHIDQINEVIPAEELEPSPLPDSQSVQVDLMAPAEKFEPSPLTDHHSDIAQLGQRLEDLEVLVQQQGQTIKEMEKKQVDSDKVIQSLFDRLNVTRDKLDPPQHLNSSQIFLIGGYNGNSWLSTLDTYSPSEDLLVSLRPMSNIRSYASASALNGDIYIFGGGDGSLWYDTVERYNPMEDSWTACPPLNQKKGSLAGASLHNKIFAIGGGDGAESFSDVEMFDPILGRWIQIQPLLEKRFAPSAVELDGILYAVGGFDGKSYLKSAERYDPREASWTKIPIMNTRRGCHSVAVLNGKLYALGGYDGSQMVSTVEVFDPRYGSWTMGSSMNNRRGYAAAAVHKDSLYVIGGVDKELILDSVECYKEAQGWEATKWKAVGKRCFFSAIVL
ncbi:hypothetical protein H6P81_016776 [Aristolochia fimbriata]|uniref:DCD domain-containing protein n=1 Tax=Aristolochia fimbriata TaxID=158543 RepID=A0AAV7EC70_ARIFI|nr:hypothetical protein H6P81_016776 [Aristolochia fimbriata]